MTNILEDLKSTKKELKEIEHIRRIKNLPLELQIDKIMPYALKSGIDNFKEVELANLFHNVCDLIINKNETKIKKLQKEATLIFSKGNENIEQFLFGEEQYSGLSPEERLVIFRKNWDEIKDKDPLHHPAYSFPKDEVLGLFSVEDGITRSEFEKFKNLYEVIKIMNKDFIQNTVNNDTSGLDLFKKHAADIENTIQVSGIRDSFREILNELLSSRFYKDDFFIPFQKEQIRGDDFSTFTGVDLINSFVREFNSDYVLRGEDLEKRGIEYNTESELIKEIPSVSLKRLNYRKSQWHGFINPILGEPVLKKFYNPTFNLLNNSEKNEIGDSLILSLRMFKILLPQPDYKIDKETGNYNLKISKQDNRSRFPIETNFNKEPDISFVINKEKFYLNSSNILLFSHGYQLTEQTENLLNNFYSSLRETNGKEFISNFYNLENFKNTFLEKNKFSDTLSSSLNIQHFIAIEIEKIKQIHKNEYQLEINDPKEITNLNSSEDQNILSPEKQKISSLSSLKNKVSNFFKSEDTKESKLKK